MRSLIYLFSLILLTLKLGVFATTEDVNKPHVRVEFMSSQDFQKTKINYRDVRSNYHYTTFYHEGFPKNESILFKVNSLVVPYNEEMKPHQAYFKFLTDGSFTAEGKVAKEPAYTFPSLGHFPGDKIEFTYEDSKGNIIYQLFATPHPLIVTNGNLKIEAQLMLLVPLTTYNIIITGLEENEEITVSSKSLNEILTSTWQYRKGNVLTISPNVAKIKGGISYFKITRKSGETCSIRLPWGKEMFRYLNKVFDPNMKKNTNF